MMATCEKRSYVWQMYESPLSSSRIFWRMNVATVFDNSDPLSIIRRHSGMISVVSKNVITSCSSVLTSAPITPKLVSRKYSKGRVFEDVWRNGYKKSGIWADKNTERVSWCDATFCRRASALHTRFDCWAVNVGGVIDGYMLIISCSNAK